MELVNTEISYINQLSLILNDFRMGVCNIVRKELTLIVMSLCDTYSLSLSINSLSLSLCFFLSLYHFASLSLSRCFFLSITLFLSRLSLLLSLSLSCFLSLFRTLLCPPLTFKSSSATFLSCMPCTHPGLIYSGRSFTSTTRWANVMEGETNFVCMCLLCSHCVCDVGRRNWQLQQQSDELSLRTKRL